jgi:hypothetical protein
VLIGKPNYPTQRKKIEMKIVAMLFAILIAGFAAQGAYAQDEKDLVIRTARALETSPEDPETIRMREQSMRWIIQTDQVTVNVCGGVFELFGNKKNNNGPDMTASYTVAMAAFKLAHPDQVSDDKAAQLAGLESALKTYEVLVIAKPKTKNDPVEKLLVKRNNGELAALVAGIDCNKK